MHAPTLADQQHFNWLRANRTLVTALPALVEDGEFGRASKAAFAEASKQLGDNWRSARVFFGIDTLAPVDGAALKFIASQTQGLTPLFWGRYCDTIINGELTLLRDNNIAWRAIGSSGRAHTVSQPSRGTQDARSDTLHVRAALEQASSLRTPAVCEHNAIWLDIEFGSRTLRPQNLLNPAYLVEWSKVVVDEGFSPRVYMPGAAWSDQWDAIARAIDGGAHVDGIWVAWYDHDSDGSAVMQTPCDEPHRSSPPSAHADLAARVTDRQYLGEAYRGRCDFSVSVRASYATEAP